MKKGVLFSFIMFFLAVTLISIMFIHISMISHKREQIFFETRIKSMNNMYDSILLDLGKVLEIIMRRAISVSVNHAVAIGFGLDNATYRLEELVLNGTLNNTEEYLMVNSTFPNWIEKIQSLGTLKGFEMNIGLNSFGIKPYDSFNLIVEMNLTLNIVDKQGVASLSRNVEMSKLIYLEDLEDPIYPLYTWQRATNIIKIGKRDGNYTTNITKGDGSKTGWKEGVSIKINGIDHEQAESITNKNEKILVTDDIFLFDIDGSDDDGVNQFKAVVSESDVPATVTIPFIANVTNIMSLVPNNTIILVDTDIGWIWDIQNLKEHAENSYYRKSLNGPSYLDRLEGNLTCNYCSKTINIIGMESMVDKNNLLSSGVPAIYGDRSNIDYLYFSGKPASVKKVKGLSEKFRIDNELSIDGTHQQIYNVTSLIE